MSSFIANIPYYIMAILAFSLLIVIHELGHFMLAKLNGVKVHEFSLGMGPKLFGIKGKETEYLIKAFPIGGYVKMEGENEESDDPRSFANKTALQKELCLTVDKSKFMIGIVSRLTDQKGLDLISYVMDQICTEDVQLVVLGTGDEKYENMFRHYDWKYNNRVSSNIYYSEEMSHKIYASCDAFLMPSLFEPCGLSQLMSLRYGTVPIVRETGGLKDTVQPYNEYENKGTGFSFTNYNAHEMLRIINYAKNIFYKKKREWNKIIDRGMLTDNSWNFSAEKYEELYDKLLEEV